MANPLPSAVHIDEALTNYAVGLMNDPSNYIGSTIFPIIPVSKQTDKYWIWEPGDYLRDGFQVRPPGTESAGIEWSISNTSYECNVYAAHIDESDQLVANADFNTEAAIVDVLIENWRQHVEQQVFTQIIASGLWGTNQTGVASSATTNQFLQFTASGSDPMATVDFYNDAILAATGKRGNTVVFGMEAWRAFKRNGAVIDQLKYTDGRVITTAMAAALLEVDRVLVARGIKATSVKGQTLTKGVIFDDAMWIGRVEPAAGMKTATAAKIFAWTGLDNSPFGAAAPNVYRIEMPHLRSVRYEMQFAYDMVITSTALGKFLTAVATS